MKGKLIEGKARVERIWLASGPYPGERHFVRFNFQGNTYRWGVGEREYECSKLTEGDEIVIRAYVKLDNFTLYRLSFPCRLE